MSRVNGIDRFWITESASSSTARSLMMPKRSTSDNQSALSSIEAVVRPKIVTSPRSGNVAPVTRLTNVSAIG